MAVVPPAGDVGPCGSGVPGVTLPAGRSTREKAYGDGQVTDDPMRLAGRGSEQQADGGRRARLAQQQTCGQPTQYLPGCGRGSSAGGRGVSVRPRRPLCGMCSYRHGEQRW
jgi:hypothetical protein